MTPPLFKCTLVFKFIPKNKKNFQFEWLGTFYDAIQRTNATEHFSLPTQQKNIYAEHFNFLNSRLGTFQFAHLMIRALQPTSKHFVMPIDHQMQLNKGHISHFSILRYWAKSTMIQQQMEWMVRSCNTAELSPDMNQHHLATIPWRKRHKIDSSLNSMRFVREIKDLDTKHIIKFLKKK